MLKKLFSLLFVFSFLSAWSQYLLIPMDETQKDHLKAYGISYWVIANEVSVEWLLNYRGGSFLIPYAESIKQECLIRGVSAEQINTATAQNIRAEISNPAVNMDVVKLDKQPKIAVYSPSGKQPWDDAVTLVLTYAEIPYDVIYDSEIMDGILPKYDWLHLHHEDFTGQFGRFYAAYRNASWYQDQVKSNTETANKYGFKKVSELKRKVSLNIKDFVIGGGFLFTMCSGTDSYDISLSAVNTDICETMFDGDPAEAGYQNKLDFNNTLAFEDFTLEKNPMQYEFSNIDATQAHNRLGEGKDIFSLFEFSAKWDIVPTMLTQNHTRFVNGFMGQTTGFYTQFLKSDVTLLGETKSIKSAKYIHGNVGKGQWTFYGGHDPEDYKHLVGDPPTDLSLHPNSPGYRLILNNVLFPAAKKKKQKT